MKSRPVDLIVSNCMHAAVDRLAKAGASAITDEAARHGLPIDTHIAMAMAEDMLCAISHNSTFQAKLQALAAIGAPSTVADIAGMLRSIAASRGEAIKSGAAASTPPAASPPPTTEASHG